MKQVFTYILFLGLLFPFCLNAQHSGEKKVTITKRFTDADGAEHIETTVKKGKAAENFDARKYVDEHRSENVQIEVSIEEADAQYNNASNSTFNWNGGGDWLGNLNFNGSCNDQSAFLGVDMDEDESDDEDGVVVQIVRGSAADKAGLRHNDKIISINGETLREWDDLSEAIGRLKAGDKTKIVYERNGKRHNAEPVLTKRNEVKGNANSGDHGYMGITEGDDDEDEAGVEVNVYKNSAAAKAGLKSGDLLLEVNGVPVKDFEDISDYMAYTKPGENVKVIFSRNNERKTLEFPLGRESQNGELLPTLQEKPAASNPVIIRQSNTESAFLGVQEDSDEDPNEEGLVVEITRGSAADRAGLRHNDKILTLNATKVDNWSDLTSFMKSRKPGEKIKISYERNGKKRTAEAILTRKTEVNCTDIPKRGFLGVSETFEDDDDAEGVKVSIASNSAASKAGLKNGDILLALDDAQLLDYEDISDFMAFTEPGDTIEITYERKGKKETALAILREEKSWDWSSWNAPGTTQESPVMNFSIREKEACLGVYTEDYNEEDQSGAQITDFSDESGAREANMQNGDVILAINGKRIEGQDGLWEELARFKAGDKVSVEFVRDENFKVTTVNLKACKEKDNRVQIYNVDEEGAGENREFFVSGWNDEDQRNLSERRVIPIRKTGDGSDAPKLNFTATPGSIPIEKRLKLDTFKVSPATAQGHIQVRFDCSPQPTIVSLFDLNGRQLFKEELNAFDGHYAQGFDLSEYSKGTVVIQVAQGDKIYVEQIIVSGS